MHGCLAKGDGLTDDDDEDPRHYLEGQGEGDECQHCNVVPEEETRAPGLSLFIKGDECRSSDASYR